MIAVDTNVLLRYLLQDDTDQAARAERLISEQPSVLITDVVLVETLWTLKGKKYRASKEDLLNTLAKLFQEPNLRFEDAGAVWRAMHDYRPSRADFPDALIQRKAERVARLCGESLDAVYRFDQNAWTLPGTREPE